ncbi:hypothetical protein PCE31107_02974 [Pandoraea cepalis]|uniref:Uncharacterized protein n=2 Tax=Pandoraea TaxID=93217 RepID=A0A5E4XG30_9BURK|nr:hypothetical protein PCE31107_02974 [Pandoraea cepalis]VVE35351.1 hypothetical protein PTE31013_03895 [Pandoraea terrigena]
MGGAGRLDADLTAGNYSSTDGLISKALFLRGRPLCQQRHGQMNGFSYEKSRRPIGRDGFCFNAARN